MKTHVLAIVAILTVVLPIGPLPAFASSPYFTLKDYVGRRWEHDLVQYRLDATQVKAVAGQKLVDSAGHEALYQLDVKDGTLLFQANIEPFGQNVYSFKDEPATAKTDIAIRGTDAYVEVANSRTGIRVAKALGGATTDTPLLSWQLASGTWAGRTAFAKPQEIKAYRVNILERGPVRARVSCLTEFANGDTWEIACELRAFEPVVKITETFDCQGKRSFSFVFTENFPAAYALSRSSSRQPLRGIKYEYGSAICQDLSANAGRVLIVEPWVLWGDIPTRTTSFSLVDDRWADELLFATASPTKWVDPEIASPLRAPVSLDLQRNADGRLSITFELAKGQREYLIGSVPGAADRESIEAGRPVPLQAQVYQMKYSDYPLDRVKDYVLSWPSEKGKTSAFLARSHQEQLLENFEVDPNTLARLQKKEPVLSQLEQYIPYYLATGDEQLGRRLVEFSLSRVRARIDELVKLESPVITVGWAPHHYRTFVTTCNTISTIYDSPALSREERDTLKAQLAFLGYVFNREAFCSPERGYAGFPNMTACVYGVRAAIASVVPGHPMQEQWMRRAVKDLRETFLDRWLDKDGNWIGTYTESFSYTRLIFDLVLGALYRSYSSGVDTEAIFHPAVKAMGQWFAEVATPRDARILNWRHDPPVGHVYKFDVLPSQFAMLAFMWKEHDPEFAAHMKWMQLEQGNKQVQAVGGFLPSFAGYRELFMANTVKPKAPRYESRHWKESSVILRNHYGHTLENMLYLIAGKGHSHYDQDSGSITLWGKGEIIADDFGYYGYAPGEDHNMIDSPAAPPAHLMRVARFNTGPALDYVRGEKDKWTRRIVFVKHPKPEGPNYYVIHDALSLEAPAHWRLWLTAKDVAVEGHRALVTGLYKVDTDIYFAALPEKAVVTIEEKTRTPCGLNSQGRYPGKNPTTQTGIHINSPRYKSLLTLVYPRLKAEKQPEVTPIARGGGFKVVSDYGTDYVFVSDKPLSYTEGKLAFEGTVGFARVSGDEVVVDLKEAGEISFGKKRLTKKDPERSR